MGKKFYLSVCAIAKNESHYMEEWVEYHRLTGVEHFYIYDNESEVPAGHTLGRQIRDGYVTVIPVRGRSQQLATYHAHTCDYRGESVWTAFLDVDEFITPRGANDLRDLMADFEAFGGLAVNWQVFGGNGHATRPNNLTISSYTRRLPVDHPTNQHVKTIARLDDVRGWTNPHRPVMSDGVFPVNECGQGVGGAFAPPSTRRVQLNHYFTRSAGEWAAKVARGCADTTNTRALAEGDAINSAATEDDRLATRFANAVRRAVRCPQLHFPHDVAGWLLESEGRELGRLATGRRVLEIGSYCGRSTICLAQRAEAVTAVDAFDGRTTPAPRPTLDDFRANLERHGVTDVVRVLQGTADEVCPGLPDRSFDLVFIDGAHDEPSVDADIRHARRLLATGG